jgi:hypothetical protein
MDGLIWLRIRTNLEGNETAEHLEKLDLIVHLQHLKQHAASQQGLPRRLSGTGQRP